MIANFIIIWLILDFLIYYEDLTFLNDSRIKFLLRPITGFEKVSNMVFKK